MAYIGKERVAEIRGELKKLFPQFKFSVTRVHFSEINIKIMKGDIDFFDDAMRPDGLNQFNDTKKLSDYEKAHKHTTVNEFWIESNLVRGSAENAFKGQRNCF